jgi:membrane protein YdbS with pleckstrin-like domain
MECHACRGTIEDDSRFCRHCGASTPRAGGTEPRSVAGNEIDTAGRALSHGKNASDDFHPDAEQYILVFRPAWRAFLGGWLLWLLASVILAVIVAQWRIEGGWKIVLLLSAAGALAVFTRQAVTIYGVRYRLTTQRLLVDRGIITRTTDQMELIRVDDVRTRQGVLDRLIDTGTVEIRSTDATDENAALAGVRDPAHVAEQIRKHTRIARGRKTLFVENV